MVRREKRIGLVFLAASLFLLTSGVATQSLGSAGPGKAERPRLIDSRYQPKLGTYYYAFEFNGLNIGTAWVELDRDGGLYTIRFRAKTNSAIDRIYKARFSGENVTEAVAWSPLGTRIVSRVRSTSKDTAMRFQDDGTIKSVRTESEKGEPLESEVREIRTDELTMDPLSVVHLIRSIDWKPGMEKRVHVFTGKHRYDSRFTCSGEKTIEAAGEKRRAWEIVQQSRKLGEEEQETDEEEKERDLKIYLSADGARDILKIDAPRAMGHFLVLLEGFEPAAGSANRESETAQGNRS